MQIFAVILWYAVVIAAGFYNATKTLAFASEKFVLIARRRVDIFETFSFHHRS